MNEVLRALDHIELKRAFGDYFGCSIEELYVRESRPLPPNPGLAGDKLICEVSMRSEGRALPPVECWIKRMVTPDHREAHLYRSLHRSQFPLPKFYGHYLDERSREVLLLEYIPRVGHSFESDEETAEWVSLLARFNAIPLGSVDIESLVNEDWAAFLISGKVETYFDAVIRYAADSLIGDELAAFCQANESKIRSLPGFAKSLHAVVSDMPKALTNNELHPGWRSDGALVAFDLHGTSVGPRFLDISKYIGEPESITIWGISLSPRIKWARIYGRELEAAGGPSVDAESILQESRLVWLVTAFHLAWCLQVAVDGDINWSEDRKENKAKARRIILAQLASLTEAQGKTLV
ncbi:MAG: hypothetical protein GKR89_02660 [Candidatus Latescibacteria bacterium]|nr:hypothetical protein [Candidatus Latescibacterota bacterium]